MVVEAEAQFQLFEVIQFDQPVTSVDEGVESTNFGQLHYKYDSFRHICAVPLKHVLPERSPGDEGAVHPGPLDIAHFDEVVLQRHIGALHQVVMPEGVYFY